MSDFPAIFSGGDVKEAVLRIEKAAACDKLAGSWLITGPVGVGKKTFAALCAGFILTGKWRVFDDFHPDLKEISFGLTEESRKKVQKNILDGKEVPDDTALDHKKEITVDEVRSISRFLSLKAGRDKKRVVIINPADAMNENAANALLKILEEPPQNAVLLLLSANEGRLLPTIRSRCKRLKLGALSESDLCARLEKVLPDCPHVDLLAFLAEGSVGVALDIEKNDGIKVYQRFLSFCRPFKELDGSQVLSFAQEVSENDKVFSFFHRFVRQFIQTQAKRTVLYDSAPFNVWADLADEFEALFHSTQQLNLSRPQSVTNMIFKLAQLIGRAGLKNKNGLAVKEGGQT